MYFKINKKDFLEKINIVSRAVSLTSPLPVLHNIKLATRENELQLTASDSDVSIEATIIADDDNGLQIINEGSILLDGKYIGDMIRKIDSDYVEVEVVDGTYTSIRGLSVHFELNGIRSDTYPLIDFSEPEDRFSRPALRPVTRRPDRSLPDLTSIAKETACCASLLTLTGWLRRRSFWIPPTVSMLPFPPRA